ncbi:hypothetical protein SAMN06265795_103209 [Noviherbaspirillum humi]|uniref:Uncharacterized protein n=1 Tax=Noviherbaspirillum humi TaxID=1688639 RepID=A0A239F636_9BURK|nr:hypothetical protein [Noviherbaspirillum humi]SNS52510.1 hypothetical protein SAMN06265795_103209 [Noviherbaspirillum humi]
MADGDKLRDAARKALTEYARQVREGKSPSYPRWASELLANGNEPLPPELRDLLNQQNESSRKGK